MSLAVLFVFIAPIYFFWNVSEVGTAISTFRKPYRPHLDHSVFYKGKAFSSGSEVTETCLECHRESAQHLSKTAHWRWLSARAMDPVSKQVVEIGKANVLNNFCIGIKGNEVGCTKCHAGYGWVDSKFDFKNLKNMDCLVCHENSGVYTKGPGGFPEKGVDLAVVAQSVGTPKRENCGSCHFNGGGGMAVKHGDLDATLLNGSAEVDIHMGKNNLLCIDCHTTKDHQIAGKLNLTEVQNTIPRVSCIDCHKERPHSDARLNQHVDSLSCQTCHIPTYANRIPTKMDWDWSKAGDKKREEDVHAYLKIKGEFKYSSQVVPEYRWFSEKMHRYLIGEKISEGVVTSINRPLGSKEDPNAKIWPFKIHRAKQPYDKIEKTLLVPMTAGKGGYWTSFDWQSALKLGAEANSQKYSGQYGFTETEMYWPINHMVASKDKALTCTQCHGSTGEGRRMDWKLLGYTQDPILGGGRSNFIRGK